ncbi:SusD/RagB family nutrient-binding outer membrane lipoprotein [uncultured Algoriphagus sp.]|uniref:SusD/RagB family nutrient-binding outer membrane lipoprotein n=1 Tax=uncultured Algoriphagus sp. TaxID=417365 RepID=UPI0030ECAEDE|tara:strand:- start:8168 stop:9808 length:1641 start_codon:yes stop_codon:yes gene_type:complete
MKKYINYLSALATGCILLGAVTSCKDLTETNINPNGVESSSVHPNLILTTVLSNTATMDVGLGFGDMAGVMQHTQLDAWFSGHNNYDWSNQSWTGNYSVLEDIKLMEQRAEALELPFYLGLAKVMNAYHFARIADLWGDAPYLDAVSGDKGGEQYLLPAFDSQQVIYEGAINDLKEANDILAAVGTYETTPQDILFEGNVMKWRKFANSLQLRIYLRVSEKMPEFASSGIQQILSDPTNFPIITNVIDDAAISFPGASSNTSWPSNTEFDGSNGSNYRRIKMCSTLVDVLQSLNDSRISVWAEKIQVPIVIDDTLPADTDEIKDGVRYISSDVAEGRQVDTDPDYVGIPPAVSNLPSEYNLNPTPGQQSYNPHVSFVSEMYQDPSGPLLKARLMSAAEVQFILAESALTGLGASGSPQMYYEAGVRASFEAWGLSGDYADYISGKAAFDNTLEQIITQKWIASWSASTEAWFDYRRTGFPALTAGPAAVRSALPLRFYYMQDELTINEDNATQAVSRLEVTQFSQSDENNSAWSKFWLLQGTGKPW